MTSDKKKSDQLKETVKQKYAAISEQSKSENEGSCCGSSCGCDTVDYAVFADDYSEMEGYNEEADLGLGCGLPTGYAHIKEGDTVVDLGSGAGNDCFVARKEVGETGRVIGLDMTKPMIVKARKNALKLGFENVSFVMGDIEEMPLEDELADVVVSNCVMNLVPDKRKAFGETYRILKEGGHFSISDVVISGELPDTIKEDAEMYAGCVAGAINKEDYLEIVEEAGFTNLKVQKEKRIQLPDGILEKYLSEDEQQQFKDSGTGIFSITLYAERKG
ncbi:arsenite methyltransferase [Fodinibius halophilus]|uniref:Arsenite methyltransferase n=1 Tax=Fodinibius halophilus TaxID=1736908 RepID=A0A6M1T440_9BACT|nr:arsenite methyltransferase [Fodinibius halophilus]NGP88837.1 arsenite methyltransferase [Fodinibius halophilus]